VKNRNGKLVWSFSIVDRKQGGAEYLKSQGTESFSMINIDRGLFDEALRLGIINPGQHKMVLDYLENPRESMRNFLIEHPEFLENALKADEKTRERAKICIDKNIYGL